MKELDWANLPFGYMKTDYNVRIYYRNEQWGELEVCSEETIPMHMAATCLHYGQEAFEGLKAFRGKDGKVRIFRLEENAARLQSTCRGILMPELSTERFKEAILKVVKLNERFIPPYESGASLYIRPLLVGTGAQVGVHPASEYLFVVFVTPVGPYFKGGFSTNPYVIIREFDRAAPLGTGIYKVGGNYAASLRANKKAHDLGYSCEFYLDAKEVTAGLDWTNGVTWDSQPTYKNTVLDSQKISEETTGKYVGWDLTSVIKKKYEEGNDENGENSDEHENL